LRVGQHEVLVGITPTQMTALAHWPEGADQAAVQIFVGGQRLKIR